MMDILITGANGFLGSAVYNHLLASNNVSTISRNNSDFQVDLSSEIPSFAEPFDLVVHCAGKAHYIPKTQEEKQSVFDVNVTGTSNLLKGLELLGTPPEFFVMISSVAVYGLETGVNINEDNPLQAKDPYGLSKIEAEKTVQAWCDKNDVLCTILRLPLLAGPNPPGNLGAMIKGIQRGYYLNIGGGMAKKSILLTEDVAKIIPVVATFGGIYNLTDARHPSFSDLSYLIAKQLGKPEPKNIPIFIGKAIARIGDILGHIAPVNSNTLGKIVSDLTFDDSKARKTFGWNPTPVLTGFKIF